MANKLLVALDGSDTAECVLSYVDALGLQAPEVTLLQVVPIPQGMSLRNYDVPTLMYEPGVSGPLVLGRPDSVRDLGAPHGDRKSPDEGYLYMDKAMERAEAEAKDYLVSVGQRLAGGDRKIQPVILFGHPAEQIIDYAEKSGADMIVMASHGRSGIRRWAFGDTADKVLRASPVPVLLIRAGICPAI